MQANSTNIYADEIIPVVKMCQPGDELLFISPSTFFGYYSLGVRNFVNVCEEIEAARGRGVEIKLIVTIREWLTAHAGKALLKILDDYTEIKGCSDNTEWYFIIRVNKDNELASSYRKFSSEGGKPFVVKYLDGNIKCLPFKGILEKRDTFESDEELQRFRREFYQIWNKGTRLERQIRKYDVDYHKRKLLIIRIMCGYFVALIGGVFFGMITVLYSLRIEPSELSLAEVVIFPLIVGILAGVIGTLLATYLIRRLDERLSRG